MPNHRPPAALFAVFAALFCVGCVGVQKMQRDMLAVEGLDHPGILVRDLEAAKDSYRDALGFAMPPRGVVSLLPSGIRISNALFEDGSYLELIAVDDREKVRRNRPSYLTFLEKQEGAKFVMLTVPSAEETAKVLRARGLDIDEPSSRTVITPGAKESPLPFGWAVTFRKPVVARDSVGFFQPADAAAREKRIRDANASGRTHHVNTAKRLAAVWIVVRDLEAAENDFAAAGFTLGARRTFQALGAAGREIVAGSGRIVLLEPKGKAGNAASFLAERGEGIMGVSIEASNVETARALLEKNAKRAFPSYAGAYGTSILIPGELAHGLWIELFQSRR